MPIAVIVLPRESYLHLDDALARVGAADDPIRIRLDLDHAQIISDAFTQALDGLD